MDLAVVSSAAVHLGEQAHYKVTQLPSYCDSYFGEPPFDPNMIAVCYLFEPKPLPIGDLFGLDVQEPDEDVDTKNSSHIQALKQSYGIKTWMIHRYCQKILRGRWPMKPKNF